MIKQRSKFLTFVLGAICPGAGQMYNGFLKRGFSFLILVAALAILTSVTGVSAIGFLIAAVWIYAFFDAMNLVGMDIQKFVMMKDEFLYADENFKTKLTNQKATRIAGIAMVVLGVVILWNSVFLRAFYNLFDFLSYPAYNFLWNILDMLPRLILAVIVIVLGFKLIRRKKTEVYEDADGTI